MRRSLLPSDSLDLFRATGTSPSNTKMASYGEGSGRLVQNQPYDESVEVSDTEEVASVQASPRVPGGATEMEQDEYVYPDVSGGPQHQYPHQDLEESEGEQSESEEDTRLQGPMGAYDPSEFDHLVVSTEVKELFKYITRFQPQNIELDFKLKPFIPEYIPAIGDIDAFLKVSRPDGKPEELGSVVLDEPSAKQSDPTVLDLHLRAITKEANIKPVAVKTLDSPEKNPKALDNWIDSIAELHRQKPPQTVHYTRSMPDVESLMQEWPQKFEEFLATIDLPGADLDCSLTEYVDIVCALLDIPVYESRVQSLHVLFSLYTEFKSSQHFKALNTSDQGQIKRSDNPGPTDESAKL